MIILGVFDQLRRMDLMIRSRSTGTPEEFARRLGISVRSLYNYLALMKETGAPIRYSRTKRTYIYTELGSFVISFTRLSSAAA